MISFVEFLKLQLRKGCFENLILVSIILIDVRIKIHQGSFLIIFQVGHDDRMYGSKVLSKNLEKFGVILPKNIFSADSKDMLRKLQTKIGGMN